MKEYVAGFMFSPDFDKIVLVEKNKPAWQAGLWNGVGGKIECGESPKEAMVREFYEETGLRHMLWDNSVTITGDDFRVYFFRAFSHKYNEVMTMEEEAIAIHDLNNLPFNLIPNLRWVIPLQLDDNSYQIEVNNDGAEFWQ